MTFGYHRTQNVSDELETSTSSRTMIFFTEGKVASGEFGGEFDILETKLVEAGFITQDGDVIVEAFDVGEVPGVIEEIAITESVFETVGGKTGNIVVGDREELIVGNFAR